MLNTDLNLLKVFDVLYQERSVTRAAARLALTQSAVSHALKRLRATMGDRLFVRVAHGLEPTARASAIAAQVQAALASLQNALATPEFDPGRSDRQFRIMAGPYYCRTVIPRLVAAVRHSAPQVTLRVVAPGPDLFAQLDAGMLDLAFMGEEVLPQRLRSAHLVNEEAVWVAQRAETMPEEAATREILARAPRVLIVNPRRPLGFDQPVMFETTAMALHVPASEHPANLPTEPGVAAVVYDAATAIALVENTDAIALVPRRLAESAVAGGRIMVLNRQAPGGTFPLAMVWHARSDDDGGMVWLRAQISALFATPGDQAGGNTLPGLRMD